MLLQIQRLCRKAWFKEAFESHICMETLLHSCTHYKVGFRAFFLSIVVVFILFLIYCALWFPPAFVSYLDPLFDDGKVRV